MKYSNSIEYNISTKLDKSGLTQLQTQIKQVELTMQQMANKELLNPTKVQNAREQLQGLSTALNKAFNPSLGMLDLAQFRKELSNSKVTAEGLQSAFRLTGAQGSAAFSSLAKQIGHFNSGMERTSSAVDKMFVTFQNTFRWGLISSFFSQFMNAIHSSVEYARELDDSLTQIMLVTDYSRDSMNEYAKAANEAAKAVGQTTVGMTNASLIFAQQGYDLDQSQQLATLSAKLANASQQDTAATSDQITAYMNAYGLQDSMEELTQAMDNWALIANISAADVEEIAVASQRAASMANAVGVSGEALAAQIATIESVTREAPEQIGNGLKTLYARFSDLQLGKEDEDGIGLGKVTSTLQQIGVQVLDSLGNVRNMDDIMEDLMAIWQDLDDTTQEAVAQTLAGKHQVNRFTALMDNADMYQEYLGATGENASGTLEQMNQEYMDSLQGRLATLQATLEGLFNDVFTTDMIYPLIDALTKLAEAVDTLFKSVGGGPTIILGLASAFMKLFSTNIARSINDFASNQQLAATRKSNLANVQGALEQTGLNDTEVGQYIQAGADRAGAMNADQYRIYEQQLDSYITASTNAAAANEKLNDTYLAVAAAAGMLYDNAEDLIILDETGLNISGLVDEVAARSPKELAESFKNIDWEPAIEGAEELSKSMGRLSIAIDKTEKDSQDLDAALQIWDKADDNLDILYETGAITEQTYKKLQGVLTTTAEALDDTGTVEGEVKKEFEQATAVIARYTEALKNIGPETLAKGPEAVAKALRDQLSAQQALDQNRQGSRGVIRNLDNQLNIENIVKTTASIGQLAFAIQSLGNLPSIWRDKDLSNAEKFYQTITNLTAALPNLITSFGQVSKAMEKIFSVAIDVGENIVKTINIGAIEKEAQAQEKLNMVKAEGAITETSDAAATGADVVAKEADTVATEGATVAQQGLNAAALAFPVTAIIAGIALVVTWLSKWRVEQQALFQERLDISNEQAENAKKELNNIEELYEAWQKTGQGADELRQALEDQAEALGVVVTAADNYETLRQKIEEATAAQLEYNAALRGENTEAPEYDFSTASQLSAEDRERLGITTETKGGKRRGSSRRTSYTTENPAETLQTAREMRDEASNQMLVNQQEMMRTTDENRYAELQAENAELQQQIGLYDTLIQENQEAYNYNKETVETAVQANALYENTAFKQAQSYEEMMTYLQAIEGFSELTLEDQIALAQQAAEWAGNLNAAAEAQIALAEYQVSQNNTNSWGAQKGDRGLAMIDTLSDQYDFTTEQKASVVSLIDWSDPEVDTKVAELLRQIREGLENGISIDDILAGTENGLNIDPEEYLRNITSDQVDNEALQESALTLYNNNDYMDQYANDLEQIPPLIKEITEAQLRYNEAVEFSASNMEKWNDTLEDLENGNANLEDLADTMGDLRETYKDFLDLNEDVSDNFIRDKKNLKLLEEAIEGNEEAYEDLAEAAAIDIVQHIDVEFDQEKIQEAENAIHTIYDLIDNEEFESLDIGELINVDSFPGLYDSISTLVDYFSAAGMSIQEIQDAILQLAGIYIPTDNFQIAGEEIAGSMDNAVAHIEGVVEGVPDTVVDNLSFAQHTTVEDDTATETDQMQYTNLIAEPIEHTKQVILPAGDEGEGKEATARYYDLVYHSETIPTTQQKQTTGQAITSEVTPGPGGKGGVSLKSGSGGSSGWRKGPTGGSKSSGSAAPRSRGGGGGGKGKSCFIAGTLVSLQNQFKEIEKIQVGDIVLSYNEENHQNEYSRVLQTMIHNTTEEIYDLYIEDEILSVTGIHRFYIRRKHDIEWIMASELNIGDYVLFADGNWHVISNINVKIQSTTVYNFEVSDNHNYYVGRNQILAHNKGGGGGGGGGKAKTIEPKEKKEHKKNYYEKVDSQLDKLKETLSGVEKQEDKLIGDKARANQQKQINLINQEIKLEQERLKILQDTADSELKDVKAAMEAKDKLAEDILKGRGINFNIPAPQYDENGIITNYENISAKIDEAHNELIKQYNDAAAAGNEDLTKTIDEAIKKYDEYSAAILENAQRQNDIQKEIESTKNTIQELKDSITDINTEIYKTSMKTIDNLKDLNEKWAEFQGLLTGMPSDSPFRDLNVDLLKLNSTFEISKDTARDYYQQIINGKIAAQKATKDKAEKEAIQASINYFTGLRDGLTDDMLKNGLLGLAMTDLEQLEKWYKNPSLKDNPFGDNQKALVEAYQEGYKRVLELSKDWQDLQEDIVKDVIDGFDEIADKQDRQLEKYERLAEELENLADVYALSYGDESYKALSDIGKRQAETLKAQLGQYVNIYNYWQEKYQEALDTGNEELANSIEDRMNDIQDEMRDIAQESAEAFVEAYENAIDAAVQDMYQGLFNENNLDHLDRNWEWDKKVIDNYRDEVEKTFEIEQLRSKYNDLLNDAQGSSLATQNKIRKQMQEQLDLLKNQESVSEYDVELANSKLLILQKQIALEDAQQNKNQMQLRRDSQGNYRYVYRASQNDIAKARQEYIQAVQDAYELTKEQRQKTAEELGNTLKDYADEWADLNKNMNLTEEERIKQSQELTEKFLNYMKHLNEDLADSQLGMSDVLNFMVENGTADVAAAAQEMLGQLFDDQGNLIEDTNIAWWDFGNDLAKKLFPYIQDATSTMNDTLTTEAEELRDKLTGPDGVITDVKKALIDEETGLRPALEDATNAIIGENGLNNAMDSLADSLENQNEKLTEGMNNIKKYTEGLAAAIDWLKTAQNAIKDLQNITVGELVSETRGTAPKNTKPAATTKSATNAAATTKSATNATASNTLDESRVQAAYNDIMSGRAGNDSARWAYLTKQGYSEREQKAAQAAVNAVYAGTAMTTAIKNAAAKYDTGGYTGKWNKEGRLAILHQKELVLNAQDTRNILSAVDIVRQMTSTLGNALTNYSMGNAKQGFLTSTLGGVDQRVEIKAEFPNVRDAFEIETALTNLADKAYQYAHRNI